MVLERTMDRKRHVVTSAAEIHHNACGHEVFSISVNIRLPTHSRLHPAHNEVNRILNGFRSKLCGSSQLTVTVWHEQESR